MSDLERLFDDTAAEPTADQVTRMAARAADAPRRRWTADWRVWAAAAAVTLAIGWIVARPPTVPIPAPAPIAAEVEHVEDVELELAVGSYLDLGLDADEFDDLALIPLEIPEEYE